MISNSSSNLSVSSVKFGAGVPLALTGFLLFFLMIFVPTTYAPVKGVLLFVILAGITFLIFRSRTVGLHSAVLSWTAVMIATGLGFVGWGYANDGSLRVGTVYVLWPFVYAMLIAGVARLDVLEYLTKFDYLWIIFLSVAFINHWLLTRGKVNAMPRGVAQLGGRGL